MLPYIPRRDARLAAIKFAGHFGLLSLQQRTIGIAGAGTLGGEVIRHLTMLGVPMVLLDRGVVEPENLGTQGFAANHVGLPKVKARTLEAQQLNPNCKIVGRHTDIEALGLAALRHVDLILCCLDSFAARLVLHDVAWRLGIPWVDAAVDGSGERLYGRIIVYDPRQPEAPCMQCSWDNATYAQVMQDRVGQGCPTWLEAVSGMQDTPPTLAISSLASVVAGLQTIQALRLLLGDTSDVGREQIIDIDHTLFQEAFVRRASRCRFDHDIWPLTALQAGAWARPVRDLFTQAQTELGSNVTLQAHRRILATELLCSTCGSKRPMAKFVHAIQPSEMTCTCGGFAQPVGFSCLPAFNRSQAAGFMHHTWQQLGLPADDVVTASCPTGRTAHFIISMD
jgi:adenylyltransferase/sulfurtransferase